VTGEPENYLVAHVREALAKDPRTNELHVEVAVSGRRVFLSGPVTSEAHRDAIADVAREIAASYEICNETSVAALDEPRGAEDLS
jgi:hypothetical protein